MRMSKIQQGTSAVEGLLLTQYPVAKGLKVFGQPGADAVKSELQQLIQMDVIQPVKRSMLTNKEIDDSLAYLMFLKQKRTGKIKGRGCADGCKQRVYKTKEQTSAPTVTPEAIFLTGLIDAMEGRKIVALDIPGAFMQAKVDEKIHV